MSATVILALISDLYGQIVQLQQQNQELIEKLAAAGQPKE